MIRKRTFLSKVKSESFLIGILCLIGLIPYPKPVRKRGRPYVYSPTVMLRCFIVRVWVRIPSNNALHHHHFSIDKSYNRRLMRACDLDRLPDRRTLDRRFKSISFDIKSRMDAIGMLFVQEGLVDPHVVSVDSCLLKAKGHIWHKSSMKQNVVPCSGIDTDARWGFSRTKGWVFGYKMNITSSTGSLIVPLPADFTSANIPDKRMYQNITMCLPEGVRYVATDEGYDDHKPHDFSRYKGFNLVCPVIRYRSTKPERLQHVQF